MDGEHWIRVLLGAGASLLAAVVTAVVRLILNRRARLPEQPPASESTEVLTLKIERHREVRPAPAEEDREGTAPHGHAREVKTPDRDKEDHAA